ncbi:MAG TPA: choice-of-anchor tandem repeat GloVer-containing protein [Terriglobales bacterium]
MRRHRLCLSIALGALALCSTHSLAATYKVIYSFQGGADGQTPYSDLVADSSGNLYGTTTNGGNLAFCNGSGCGTVFELKRSEGGGWEHKVLYSFGNSPDGELPKGGLVLDEAGALYGTTAAGGANGWGTVFKAAPTPRGGWQETVIYSFTGNADGYVPTADLTIDKSGNIYGTTTGGNLYCASGQGSNGCGAVFELTPQANGSWVETTIYTFDGGNGATPSSGIVLDSAGNLYGTTYYGGGAAGCGTNWRAVPPGCGIAYKLSLSGNNWLETIPYAFTRGGGFGLYPTGGIVFANPNLAYGITQSGGDGYGTVFELIRTKEEWQQRDRHIFYGTPDGVTPVGRITPVGENDLFGVTQAGGSDGQGVVFELQHLPAGSKEIIIHSFSATGGDGTGPQSGLTLGPQDHLYGTTSAGGSGSACKDGCGTVYDVAP